MKKYISTLALIAAFTPSLVMAATTDGNGHANAKIVTPVEVTESQEMNFGTMLGKANKVTVTSAGVRSASNSAGLVTDGNTPRAGILQVTGPNNQPITVALPESATVQSDTNSMTISNFTSPQSGSRNLDGTGQLTINVGADLTVTEGQPEGDYRGPYTITITY